jgi:8-oxo-dGTP pyrophosphatase MutT (NUDIX family)
VAAQSDYISGMSELLRHIAACNNAVLPGRRLPVLVSGQLVGWVLPELAEQAAGLGAVLDGTGLHLAPAGIDALSRTLAERSAFPWRAEAFDVRARPDGPALAQIDRGALPKFGIAATGVHVNGLVGDRVWVAHRARDKLLDPGKLDHIVAGGVPAGHTVLQTLVKEGEEEAGLPPSLMQQARPVGIIEYAMERDEGLRRDVLHCFDLELPENVRPEPRDGEVERFELWTLDRVLDTMRRTDDFKFNVNLVLIDLLIRRGVVGRAEAQTLR